MTNPSNGDQTMTETPPNQGDQTMTETPPNQGDQTMTNPSNGDQPMTNPGNGDQTMTNPNREDQPMTNPSNGDKPMEDISSNSHNFNTELADFVPNEVWDRLERLASARDRQMAEWSLYYASLGIRVFPVRRDAKRPCITGWQTEATTDPARIAAWWCDQFAGAMIGCPAGAHEGDAAPGLILLDIDRKNGRDGLEALERVEQEIGLTPADRSEVKAVTPSGGEHFWYRWPGGVEIKNRGGDIGEGIDVRGCAADGGRCGFGVLPPSRRADGGSYRWVDGGIKIGSLLSCFLGEPPVALLWLMVFNRKERDLLAEAGIHGPADMDCDPQGWRGRYEALRRLKLPEHAVSAPESLTEPYKGKLVRYLDKAIDKALSDLEDAPEGSRNTTLGEVGLAIHGLLKGAAHVGLDEDTRDRIEEDAFDRYVEIGVGMDQAEPPEQRWERTRADAEPRNLSGVIAGPEDDFEDRREADEGGGDGAAEDGSAGADAGAKLRRRFNTPEFRFPDDPVWANRERAKVRTAAIERDVSPEALLMLMLARLSAKVPYTWRARTKDRRTVLNTFVALIGVSGGGNSEALKAADELIPDSPEMASPAFKTGEGLRGDFFGEGKDRGKRVCWNVFSSSDEGSLLKETAHGSGATALGVLNSLWSGAKAGGSTRTSGRQTLAAGTYSLGVAFRLHPENAGYVLSQIGNGAAQRFICVNGHRLLDQEIPDQREVTAADFAEHLDFGLPRDLDAIEPPAGLFDGAGGEGVQQTGQAGGPEPVDIVFPDDLAAEAKRMSDEAFKKATDEGKKHEIDSQAAAVLIKLSALLAIFSGRRKATWDDWRAAKAIWDCSKRVRDAVLQWEQDQSRQELKRKASGQAAFESEVETRKHSKALASAIRSAAKAMDRHARDGKHEGGPCTRKCVTLAMRSSYRKAVTPDEVIAGLREKGLIEEIEGGYRRTKKELK